MLPHPPITLARYNLTQHGVKYVVPNIKESCRWNMHCNSGQFCPHCDAPACERDYIGSTQFIHDGMLWSSHIHVCDCCNQYFHIPVSAKKYEANSNG